MHIPNWIKKLALGVFSVCLLRQEAVKVSPYQRCISLINETPVLNSSVYSETSEFKPLYSTLEKYTEFLNEAGSRLEKEMPFYFPSTSTSQTVKTRKFFMTKDGEYIDVPGCHQRWARAAMRILGLYDKLLDKPQYIDKPAWFVIGADLIENVMEVAKHFESLSDKK